MAIVYYLRFTGADGKALTGDDGTAEWFEVSDFRYGRTEPLNIQTTGVGAGKVTFDPLIFTLGSHAASSQLDLMLARDSRLTAVQLVSYELTEGQAPVKRSTDVFKLGELKSDSVDINTGLHEFTLDYGGHVESSTEPLSKQTVTQGWNRVTNRIDNSLIIDAGSGPLPDGFDSHGQLKGPSVAASNPATRDIYMKLIDASGKSVSGLGWVKIDAASFARNLAIDITGSKISFDPLDLIFDPGSLAPKLDQALAAGVLFKSAEFAVYDQGRLADDYQFGVAALKTSSTQFGGSGAAEHEFRLDYVAERVTHIPYDANANALTPVVESWDLANNQQQPGKQEDPGPILAPNAATDVKAFDPGASANHYYLRFTDFSNHVLVGDGDDEQWFEISDFSYDSEQTIDVGSLSGGGAVDFRPFRFNLASNAGVLMLDRMLANGAAFKTVELLGYSQIDAQTPVKISTDVFKLAAMASDEVDAVTGQHEITMGYGGHVEGVVDPKTSQTIIAGWDQVHNVADNDFTAAIVNPSVSSFSVSTFDPKGTEPFFPNGVPVNPIVPAPADQPRSVYMKLFDSFGVSRSGDAWIRVNAAQFANEQLLNIGPNGAGAGKVAFDPLSLTFNPGLLAPQLNRDLYSGEAFKRAEFAVYEGGKLVDDYQFGRAGLDASRVTLNEDGATHAYGLEYGAELATHYAYDQQGNALTPTRQSWDRVKNLQDTTGLSSPNAPTSESKLTVYAPSPGASRYFLRFLDKDGNPLTGEDGKAEWFEVKDVAYGATQTLDISSQTSGVGAGKAQFEPLSFTLGANAASLKLDQYLTSGNLLKRVELQGYSQTGGPDPVKVSSDVFKLAVVRSDVIDLASGRHDFTLDYGGEVQTAIDPASSQSVTKGFNQLSNKADDKPTNFIPSGSAALGADVFPDSAFTAAPGADARHIYMKLTDYDGNSVSGDKWIAVDAASFEREQTLDLSSQSTGGSNTVVFHSVDVTFNPLLLGPKLDQLLANGSPLKNVELAVYDGLQRIDDYQFSLAALHQSETAHSGGDLSRSYRIDYGALRATHNPSDAPIDKSTTFVETWDRVRNSPTLGANENPGGLEAPNLSADVAVFAAGDAVAGANNSPTAVNDLAAASAGVGGTASGNVLSNDSDPDHDPLIVTTVGTFAGQHGNLTLQANGAYVYTVTDVTGPLGAPLHDVFSYTVSDGSGGTADAQLDVSASRLSVNVATYLAQTADLDAQKAFTVADTWANVRAHLRALSVDPAVAQIVLTDASPVGTDVTALQALTSLRALGLVSAPWVLQMVIRDSSTNVDKLTKAQKAALAAVGVRRAVIYEGPGDALSLSLGWNADGTAHDRHVYGVVGRTYTEYDIVYGANGKPATTIYSDDMTATWSYDASNVLTQIHYIGVVGAPYSSYTTFFGADGKPVSMTFDNGVTKTFAYNSDGSYTVLATGVTGAPYASYTTLIGADGKTVSMTFDNGMSRTFRYNADGSYVAETHNPAGSVYSLFTDIFSAPGARAAQTLERAVGASQLRLLVGGQTVRKSGADFSLTLGDDAFSLGLHSNEQIVATGSDDDVFSFGAGFGVTTITGFNPSDTLSFKLSMFKQSWFTPGASEMDDAIALIGHATQIPAGVTLSDASGDTLLLRGVSLATLQAHPETIRFS